LSEDVDGDGWVTKLRGKSVLGQRARAWTECRGRRYHLDNAITNEHLIFSGHRPTSFLLFNAMLHRSFVSSDSVCLVLRSASLVNVCDQYGKKWNII